MVSHILFADDNYFFLNLNSYNVHSFTCILDTRMFALTETRSFKTSLKSLISVLKHEDEIKEIERYIV